MRGIIGETDILSIGQTDTRIRQTFYVQKQQNIQTFWDRVKLAMVAKKMKPTQAIAAKIAQRSQATISEIWNKPNGAPEHDVVVRLARELGVCVEWLYTARGDMKPGASFKDAEQLLSVWNDLSDADRRALTGWALARVVGIGDDSPFVKPRNASSRSTKATS